MLPSAEELEETVKHLRSVELIRRMLLLGNVIKDNAIPSLLEIDNSCLLNELKKVLLLLTELACSYYTSKVCWCKACIKFKLKNCDSDLMSTGIHTAKLSTLLKELINYSFEYKK